MTNFFKNLEPIVSGVDLQFNLKAKGDQISVMVTTKGNIKDKAAENLQPLLLTGTADELDEGFLIAILHPLNKAAGIISNIKAFEEGTDKLAKENEAAKKQAEQERKEKEERAKKYAAVMKKAEEAESKKEWKKALDSYTEALQFTEQIEPVEKKINDVRAKMSVGSLFEVAPENAGSVQKVAENVQKVAENVQEVSSSGDEDDFDPEEDIEQEPNEEEE